MRHWTCLGRSRAAGPRRVTYRGSPERHLIDEGQQALLDAWILAIFGILK